MSQHNSQADQIAATEKFLAFQKAREAPAAMHTQRFVPTMPGSGGVFADYPLAATASVIPIIIGTGGVFTNELAELMFKDAQRYNTASGIQLVIDDSEMTALEEAPKSKTISDKLNAIKEGFGLSMSGFATALDVSRPSLYAWLKGEIPSDTEVLKRVGEFYQVSLQWTEINPVHYPPRQLLKQSLPCGFSFRTLLEENFASISSDQALQELADLMRAHEAQLEERRSRRGKNVMSETDQRKNRRTIGKTVYFD